MVMPLIRKDEELEPYTTFGIGGVAEYFVEVSSVAELAEAAMFARESGVPMIIIAGGSNVVCAARVAGLVIKIAIRGRAIAGRRMRIGAGEALLDTVHAANTAGLAGLETLAGIPGTVGGAIVGNAGAYGTEIGSRVGAVEVYDGERVITLSPQECAFAYRDSVFKHRRDLVVLTIELQLAAGDADALAAESARIVGEREKRYPPGLLCPGSFFKNMLEGEVAPEIRKGLPPQALVHGKVAAGYLIEAVGGRGLCVGGACVASYHGNLLVNTGTATYADVQQLAGILRKKVSDRFGVVLEEEIRYIQ